MKAKIINLQGKKYYQIKIVGLTRNLKIFKVAPKTSICIINCLGDTELVFRLGRALAKKLPPAGLLVTAEVKSIPLAYEVARRLKLPYVVARKIRKPYMGKCISDSMVSITTGTPQTLHLDEKDLKLLKNKKVIIIDDVISTGATIRSMRKILQKAQAKIVAEAAIFTEGDSKKWANVISLGNLPVITS